jgi:hypothetical protein
MKNLFHKLATYSALVLAASLPLPVDAFAEVEKKPDSVSSFTNADRHSSIRRRNAVLAKQNRRIANEAKDAATDMQ